MHESQASIGLSRSDCVYARHKASGIIEKCESNLPRRSISIPSLCLPIGNTRMVIARGPSCALGSWIRRRTHRRQCLWAEKRRTRSEDHRGCSGNRRSGGIRYTKPLSFRTTKPKRTLGVPRGLEWEGLLFSLLGLPSLDDHSDDQTRVST
jgi:hypothetical protein